MNVIFYVGIFLMVVLQVGCSDGSLRSPMDGERGERKILTSAQESLLASLPGLYKKVGATSSFNYIAAAQLYTETDSRGKNANVLAFTRLEQCTVVPINPCKYENGVFKCYEESCRYVYKPSLIECNYDLSPSNPSTIVMQDCSCGQPGYQPGEFGQLDPCPYSTPLVQFTAFTFTNGDPKTLGPLRSVSSLGALSDDIRSQNKNGDVAAWHLNDSKINFCGSWRFDRGVTLPVLKPNGSPYELEGAYILRRPSCSDPAAPCQAIFYSGGRTQVLACGYRVNAGAFEIVDCDNHFGSSKGAQVKRAMREAILATFSQAEHGVSFNGTNITEAELVGSNPLPGSSIHAGRLLLIDGHNLCGSSAKYSHKNFN